LHITSRIEPIEHPFELACVVRVDSFSLSVVEEVLNREDTTNIYTEGNVTFVVTNVNLG